MKKVNYIIIGIIFFFFVYFLITLSSDIYDGIKNKEIDNLQVKIKNKNDNKDYILGKKEIFNLRKELNNYNKRNLFFLNDNNDKGYYMKDDNTIISNYYSKLNYKSISDSVIDFSKFLSDQNIDFLYLENPYKSSGEKNELEKYNFNYDIQTFNKMYKRFEKNGVDYIDTNKVVNNFDNKYESKYYKGDYHWTSETAKNFSQYFANYLNKNYKYDLDIDILNDKNFSIIKHDKSYAGYYTRGFGFGNRFYDDISFYYYNKDSNFKATYDEKIKIGTFNEVMYRNPVKLKGEDDELIAATLYESQMDGIHKIKHIENLNSKSDKSIFVISDSQFFPMWLFVSLLFKDTTVIDIRKENGNFDTSVRKYIKNNKPDLVIYMIETFKTDDFKRILN